MRTLIFSVFAVLVYADAQAAQVLQTWHMLSDSSPGGPFFDRAPGPDLLWGTGDEVAIPGQNPSGHSGYITYDAAPGEIFAVAGGSWTQLVDTVTFEHTYNSLDGNGTFNCPATAGCVPEQLNVPYTASLTTVPGPSPTASVNGGGPIGFQVSGYELDQLVSDGNVNRRTGTSYLLFPGQDATALFGADIGASFAEILTSTALPSNAVVAFWLESFEVIAGPDIGITGVNSGAGYIVNQVVVPVPAALPLILSAFAALHWPNRRSRRA